MTNDYVFSFVYIFRVLFLLYYFSVRSFLRIFALGYKTNKNC